MWNIKIRMTNEAIILNILIYIFIFNGNFKCIYFSFFFHFAVFGMFYAFRVFLKQSEDFLYFKNLSLFIQNDYSKQKKLFVSEKKNSFNKMFKTIFIQSKHYVKSIYSKIYNEENIFNKIPKKSIFVNDKFYETI